MTEDFAGAYRAVSLALRSQGARHTKAQMEALTRYLLDGGTFQTYGERFAQIALQVGGFLPTPNSDPKVRYMESAPDVKI